MKFIFYLFIWLIIIPSSEFAALFVVDQPGVFAYGIDISYTPTFTGDVIISVKSSDVTVRGDGNTFFQGNALPSINGIEIAAGLNNVRIQNLRIQDVTGTGIVINEGCSNIRVENVQIDDAGVSGVSFLGTSANPIDNSVIRDCTVLHSCTNTSSGGDAITLQNCEDSQIKVCTIESCGNASTNFSAVLLDTCTNCIVEDVKMLTCSGLDITAFKFVSTIRSSIMASAARNNTASGAFVGVGLSGTTNLNNTVSDCLLLRNISSNANTGISLGANSQANVINNATILANSSTGADFNGIHLSGGSANNFNNTMLNCLIQSNQTSSGNSNGILIDDSDYGVINNCIISFNTASSVCAGINFQSGTGGNNWLLSKCEAVRNNGSGSSNSYGIWRQTGNTNLFFNNLAFNNGSNSVNQMNGVPGGSITGKNTANLNSGRGATNFRVIP